MKRLEQLKNLSLLAKGRCRPGERAIVKFAIAGFAMLIGASVGPKAYAAGDLFKPDAFSGYQANVGNGKTLVKAAGCASCHSAGNDLNVFSGGLKMDTFAGAVYVPNISPHTKGIGGWTNSQFLNALINGVAPDGRHYLPVFPYTAYAGMKPEDVLDMKAYLATLKPSDNKVPPSEVSFPFNTNFALALWKRANFDTPRWQPGKKDQISRGKYLVDHVGACGSCHTPRSVTYGIDNSKHLEGNKGLTGAFAPAIHKATLASLGRPNAFTKGTMMDGKKLNGQPMTDPIMKKIAKDTAEISPDDRLAMFAYITGKELKFPKPKLKVATCNAETSVASTGASPAKKFEAQADEFMGKYCRNCHGPGESSERIYPSGDMSSIASNPAFVTPGDPQKSPMFVSIINGRMPKGPRPTDAEIAGLSNWITALGAKSSGGGAVSATTRPPRARDVISRADFISAALKDIGNVSDLDRKFIRYFSYRYQYNGRFPCETDAQFVKRLDLYRSGFRKLLNSVSRGNSMVVPDAVDRTKELLVRVDIRDLGWSETEWEVLEKAYPFGIDVGSDATLGALASATNSTIPIIRTDWFMANGGKPKIYHALLRLPDTIRKLEKEILNINAEDNIARRRVMRAGFNQGSSAVSANNRMIERHDLPQGGYYWKSYDMAKSTGDGNLRDRPHGPADNEPLDTGLKSFVHDGGEMLFSLPNGMQAYYLSTAAGDRLDDAPEKVVSYQIRPKNKGITIINGKSCFECHVDGILYKRDQFRSHIETTNLFTQPQRELLLEMYVEQKELDAKYKADRDLFVNALDKIGATLVTPDGTKRSKPGPDDQEIITWYADLYENDLDLDELAAEFGMTADDFKLAVERSTGVEAARLATSWLIQLRGGKKVSRFEVEEQFAFLVGPLLNLKPLRFEKEEIVDYDANDDKPIKVVAKNDEKPDYKTAIPAYQKPEYAEGKRLALSIKVAATDVKVGDKLSFEVSSNRQCELQILYVESSGNVEVFPDQLVGDPNLKAGQFKRIPAKGTGDIEFDEPGYDESLILFCREGGLGSHRLTKKTALKIAKASGKPSTRGIAFNLAKKVEKSKGDAAFHVVTFNVK